MSTFFNFASKIFFSSFKNWFRCWSSYYLLFLSHRWTLNGMKVYQTKDVLQSTKNILLFCQDWLVKHFSCATTVYDVRKVIKYHQIDLIDRLITDPFDCPPGTHWNENVQVCDFSEAAGCDESESSESIESSESKETLEIEDQETLWTYLKVSNKNVSILEFALMNTRSLKSFFILSRTVWKIFSLDRTVSSKWKYLACFSWEHWWDQFST